MTNDDLLQQYEADPGAVTAPKNVELAEITKLARRQLTLAKRVERAEAKLTAAKQELAAVEEKALPEAMLAVGLTDFTMKNKARVKISDVIRAAIPRARAEEALRWLTVHGQGGLIKGEVSVTFGRADRRVEALVALFKQKRFAGLEYDRRETVHAGTLSAWVRQQVDAGKTVPTDLLGVYRVIKAVIVPPKVKTLPTQPPTSTKGE